MEMTALNNSSESTVVISGFAISGAGVGSVASVRHVAIVPWGKGGNGLPDTIYQTYPPAGTLPGRRACVRQTLFPVSGYVLKPRAKARALVLIRIARPGRLNFHANSVSYSSDGHDYTQTIDRGIRLRAVDHGKPHPISTDERRCLSITQPLSLGRS